MLAAIYFPIAPYHFQISCHKNQLFHFQSSSHHRVWTLSNGFRWTWEEGKVSKVGEILCTIGNRCTRGIWNAPLSAQSKSFIPYDEPPLEKGLKDVNYFFISEYWLFRWNIYENVITLDSNKKQIFSAKNGTDFLGIFKYINILKDLVAIYFSIASYHFQIFCHKNQLFHFQSSSHHRVWTLSNGCMWTWKEGEISRVGIMVHYWKQVDQGIFS